MYEVHSADLLGTTIRYHQLGVVRRGRPVLLLLHGIGDNAQTWDPVLAALAERPARSRPTVIAVDMLGHGGSSKPRTDYSLGAHANVLRDLLDHLNIDRAVLVGHSLGGGIAMQFVYQYPERVNGLVLESTGGLGPDVFPLLRAATLPGANTVIRAASATLVARSIDRALDLTLRAVRASRIPLPADVDDVLRIVRPLADVDARAAFLFTLRSVVDPAGQRVSALTKLRLAENRPITLVWGDRDPIIPVTHGRDAAAVVPEARYEEFPGAGHFPHRSDPARFAGLLVTAAEAATTSVPRRTPGRASTGQVRPSQRSPVPPSRGRRATTS